MIHAMPDLETWSLADNAAIWAIGAVKFDGNEILDRFQIGVDMASCKAAGLDIDPGTVDWWMAEKQDDARKIVRGLGKVDLFTALDGFAMWLADGPHALTGSVWGNGAIFDLVKLNTAYRSVGMASPWSYKQEECYRTFKNRLDPEGELFERVGVLHVPADDAESQARHLIGICRKAGIEL